MLDLKWEIENCLGRAAILATMSSTLRHERIERVQRASSWLNAAARSVAA
jgi:hypothetical protein